MFDCLKSRLDNWQLTGLPVKLGRFSVRTLLAARAVGLVSILSWDVSDGVSDGVSDWFLEEPELVLAEPELVLFFL